MLPLPRVVLHTPVSCALIGVSVCAQGALFELITDVGLTNGLGLQLGP